MFEYTLCERCKQWSPTGKWRETEVYCEDCGDHPALVCPNPDCEEVIDTIYVTLAEKVMSVGEAARLNEQAE